MEEVWAKGEVSVRSVMDALNERTSTTPVHDLRDDHGAAQPEGDARFAWILTHLLSEIFDQPR